MQDVIQREILIHAKQEKVYAAIADPEQVVKWFPETLEGDYAPGKQPIFGFGEHGKNQIHVVAAQPHSYFAFRWVPGATNFLGDVQSVATTLVEFHITETAEGVCRVTLKESGFAALPAAIMTDSYQQNTGGWAFMMNRLGQLFVAS